jgi:hypothetical protein
VEHLLLKEKNMKRSSILWGFAILSLIGCSESNNSDVEGNAYFTEEADAIADTLVAEDAVFVPMEMHFKGLSDIPKELDYEGVLVDAWWWNDLNGENYFIRSLEAPVESNTDDQEDRPYDFPAEEQYLHAYHYVLTDEDSELVLKRELIDFVKQCDWDMKVEHIEDVRFNDADQDNYGEITFGYMLACRSDVSPADFKVFTLENGEKYGLRGSSDAMGYGGEFEKDADMKAQADSIQSIAVAYWEAHKVEFE